MKCKRKIVLCSGLVGDSQSIKMTNFVYFIIKYSYSVWQRNKNFT